MIKWQYFLAPLCFSMLLFQVASAAVLSHSPMLGAVTGSSIKIWIRADSQASASIQYQLSGGNWSQASTSGPVSLMAQNDFTGTVAITDLSPSQLYDYRVVLDGAVQPNSTATFQTLPPQGAGGRFSFVFGADIDQNFKPHLIFDNMALHQPDFALLLGDVIYADLESGTEEDFWDFYKDNRDVAFQEFASQFPIFATWDDHDYGNNDEDKFYTLKAESRAAFGKYWPNPAYVEQNASIHYKFSAADTDFFMLDTRWNREPGVTMLGAAQLQWLKSQLLASTATFKFIVSTVQLNDFSTTGNDAWIGFPQERDEIFQFITQNNIRNVIFLTGDQHWAGVFLIDHPVHQIGQNIQGFYEFSPTPLSAFTFPAPTTSDPEVLFTADGDFYYGLIRVDTTVTPAQLEFEIRRDSDDQIIYSLTVEEFTAPSLAIVTASLPDANLGSAYSRTLQAEGGIPPYDWGLVNGTLPPGLTLNSNGMISGTPTALGSFNFTIEVEDNALSAATRPFSIVVNSAPLIDENFSGNLSGWTVVDEGTNEAPSAWAIVNGVLVQSRNTYGGSTDGADPAKPGTYFTTGDTGWTDYELQVRLMSQDDDGIGVMFRYQDAQNYYRFAMDRERAYRRLTKTVNGVTTILAEDAVPYQMNRWYAVQVRVEGNRIRLYLDGALLFDVTDSALDAGQIALYCWGNDRCHFDDVQVIPLSFFIATSSLPDGDKGVAYSYALEAGGGLPPYTWSVASGTLPSGLSLSSSGGISGTPTTPGTFDFTVRALDQQAQSKTRALSLTIYPESLFREEFNAGLSPWTIVDEGTNSAPSAWAIANGVLVQSSNIWGGTLDADDPVKPGTYVYAGNASWTDYDFIVSLRSTDDDVIGAMFRYQDNQNYYRFAMDQQGQNRRLTKTVGGSVTVLAEDDVQYATNQWYDLGVSVLGNRIIVELDGTTLFDVADTSIPSGKIALYCWANQNCNFDHILVNSPSLRIASLILPNGMVGTPYSEALTAAGGISPYTWDVIGGSLPSGLSLSPAGIISGTPTAAQVAQFTVQVSDADGATDSKSLTLTVNSAPLIDEDFSGNLAGWVAVDEGTNEAPSAWAIVNGVLVQSRNTYGGSTDGADPAKPGTYFTTGDTGWTDYELQVRLMSQDDDGIGVMFRYQDADNYYRFAMDRERAYRRLTKTVGGVTTTLAEDAVPYQMNRWYAVQVRVEGSRIRVYLDGVLLFDVTDSALAAGQIALYCWGNDRCHFDDVKVFPLVLTILQTILPAGTVGSPYSHTLTAAGGVEPYSWSVSAGSLPSGLQLNTSGLISGTPTAAGTFPFTVRVQDQTQTTTTKPLSLSITGISGPPVVIETAVLPDGTAGGSYDQTLAANGGTSPYQWSLANGALPPGITLSTSGRLSGTPTQVGAFDFTVKVEDAAAQSDTQLLSLLIRGVPLLNEDFSGDLDGWASVDEGTNEGPSVWTVVNGVLVQSSNIYGGSTDGANPVKPGTYFTTGHAGWTDYELQVRMLSQDDDAFGVMFRYQDAENYYRFSMDRQRSYRRLTKTVNGVTTVLAEDGVAYEMNRWYEVRARVEGNRIRIYLDGVLLFDVTDSALASGNVGLYCWGNPSQFDDVKVFPLALSITQTTLPDGTMGTPYSQTLTASGGLEPYTWSLVAGALPQGVQLSSGGVISGTPAASGSFSFTVRVQDQAQEAANKPFTLVIQGLTLFSDNFGNGLASWTVVDDGTNDAPSAWAVVNGVLVQSSNIYGGNIDGADPVKPGTFVHAGDVGWTDYDYSVRLRSTDDDGIGVMFRYQDAQNYYRFAMDRDRGFRQLVKVAGGVSTTLAQDTVPYTMNQWYTLKVSVEGSDIQVYLDGTLLFDVVDASIDSGRIALYSWGNQDSNFDDVTVAGR